MILTIIIPTYNRKELLSYGLQSIARQNVPWPFEIIVLNEYCEDGTREICQQYSNIRYVLTRPNLTSEQLVWRVPGTAINIGIKLAQSPIIIIACPEMYLIEPDIISNLVTPLITNSKIMTRTIGYDDQHGVALDSLRNCTLFPELAYSKDFAELCTFYPFFLGMNRQEVINIGGYDTEFNKGVCYDDTDFVHRMELNGCPHLLVPGNIVHLYHPRLRYGVESVRDLLNINKAYYTKMYMVINRNEGMDWGKL